MPSGREALPAGAGHHGIRVAHLEAALLESEVQAAREALEEALEEVAGAITGEEARFPAIEEGEDDPALASRNLAFLEKWQAELKARFAGLW